MQIETTIPENISVLTETKNPEQNPNPRSQKNPHKTQNQNKKGKGSSNSPPRLTGVPEDHSIRSRPRAQGRVRPSDSADGPSLHKTPHSRTMRSLFANAGEGAHGSARDGTGRGAAVLPPRSPTARRSGEKEGERGRNDLGFQPDAGRGGFDRARCAAGRPIELRADRRPGAAGGAMDEKRPKRGSALGRFGGPAIGCWAASPGAGKRPHEQ